MKMIIISHEVDSKANVTLHFQGSFNVFQFKYCY